MSQCTGHPGVIPNEVRDLRFLAALEMTKGRFTLNLSNCDTLSQGGGKYSGRRFRSIRGGEGNWFFSAHSDACHLAIKPVDIAGAVELFEQAGVHEFFRVGGLGGRDAVAYVFKDSLESFRRGIGFGPDGLADRLIRFLQLFFIVGLSVLRQR